MSKKSIALWFGLACGLALASVSWAADSSLVGWWKLDETSGTTALDSAGGDNNGTLGGSGLNWLPQGGKFGGALESTTAGSYINFSTTGMSVSTGTIALWANLAASQTADTRYFWGHTTIPAYSSRIQIYMDGSNTELDFGLGSNHALATNIATLNTGTWYHIAVTWNAGSYAVYLDGQEMRTGTYGGLDSLNSTATFGNNGNTALQDQVFFGLLDEVAVYNKALSLKEVQSLMKGGLYDTQSASGPEPQDKAVDVVRDGVISWLPGQYAAAHDVYFGTVFEDVNTAGRTNPKGVLDSQDQTDTTFDPAGLLDFGQTYYWRIDEVNAPDKPGLKRGNVWSFTAETYGYRIATPIKATASSFSNALTGPEKTIDGSGLDALDQHSTSASQMWLSKKSQTPVWIQYEFDAVYSLHQMWVWNQNQMTELDNGYGAMDVTIDTSTNGTNWTALAGGPEFAQATGEDSYVHNTTVDFSGVLAKFVRLNINSNWGGAKNSGLSEVRFFYVPMKAFGPTPATGATGVAVESALNWRAGRKAASHEVYLGTDPNAMTKVGTVTDHRYNLGSAGAEYDRTYYWKVDEVNEAQASKTLEGDVWSFSTSRYVVIDDFDSYNDTCNRIFYTWVDGYGATPSTECGGSSIAGNGSGAAVGNSSAPYAEKTIIHGGRQSMPLFYDNSGATSISEATRTFAVPQDWVQGGIKTLVLYFHGAANNAAGQLYVKINNSKVVYNGNSDVLTMPLWKQWNVDLSSVGGNLRSVTSLTIGVSGSGKGLVLVDDIRLYRSAPAVATPVDPGTTNRMAYYAMEGDAKNGSGKGYNGTLVGDPAFADSAAGLGKALLFDAVNDYVELPIAPLLSTLTSLSVTGWVNFDTGGSGTGYYERFFDFGTSATINMFLTLRRGATGTMRFAITTGGTTGESGVNAEVPLPTGWHHLSGVIDGTTMTMGLYLDGSLVASGPTLLVPKDLGATTQNWLGRSQYTADNYFKGTMDNVGIYNCALTEGEIRFLAGDR